MKRGFGVLAAVTVAALAACGSGVSREEMQNANGLLPRSAVTADAAAPVSDATIGAEADAAPAAAAGAAPEASAASPAPLSVAPGAPKLGSAAVAGARSAGRQATAAASSASRSSPTAGGATPTPSADDRSRAAAATGTATAPAAPGSNPATGPEVLLGAIGTASGPIGAQVAAIPIAVRAWSADVNARGGLNGRPVRIISGDDGGNPARALALARQMIERDKVTILFGNYGPTTVQAIIPYLEDRRIPLVGGMSGNPAEDGSPMVFNAQTGADLGTGRSWWAPLVDLTDATKVALLYCREAQVCVGGANRVKQYAPVVRRDIVFEAQVSLAQPDFTAEVIAARNAGAQAVMGIFDFASWRRLISAAERQGWRPFFMGGPSVYDDQILQGDAALVEGMLGYGRTTPYSDSPRLADYRAAVKRYVPNGFLADTGAAAWVNGKLLERVATAIGDAPLDAPAIVAALHGLRGETLGGLVPPLTFPDGPHGRVNLCVVSVQVRQGRWVTPKGVDRFLCAEDNGLREVVVR